MKRRSLVLLAVLALLALGAGGWYLYKAFSSRSPSAATTQAKGARVETVNGETVVIVPADMQHASGIVVSPLASTQLQPEVLAYASVIDPQPLFDLGTRLAAARAEVEAARTQVGVSAAQAARTLTLFQDDRNASQKNLQDARAAAQADRAKVTTSEATLAGLEAAVRQQFGNALSRAAASPGSEPWRRLMSGRVALLRVVFPVASAAPGRLAIDAPVGGELIGHKLSETPQVDPMLQGAAYFYLVAEPLPIGTRTVAHVPTSQQRTDGVLVPEGAIVWYGDTRWTYVRTAAEHFTRRLVQPVAPTAGGVLATTGLRAGDYVVTRGAPLLLSEEQRPHGIATQCKDPPECDD